MNALIQDIEASTRKSTTMPGVNELRCVCNDLIKEHFQEYQFTSVELELNRHGHKVIWGVPNRPQYNPIEFLWAYAKNHVTRKLSNFRFQLQGA